MASATPITVAYGDGIGPEIMEATLHIIEEAGARLEKHVIEIGEKQYLKGNMAGIEPSAFESLLLPTAPSDFKLFLWISGEKDCWNSKLWTMG